MTRPLSSRSQMLSLQHTAATSGHCRHHPKISIAQRSRTLHTQTFQLAQKKNFPLHQKAFSSQKKKPFPGRKKLSLQKKKPFPCTKKTQKLQFKAISCIFAQKPLTPQIAPNSSPNPQIYPKNPALPHNPPGVPTEFILSAILNSEFSRNFPNFPEAQIFHRIPEISGKSGEERNSRNQPRYMCILFF